MQVAVVGFDCPTSTGLQTITSGALGGAVPKAVLFCVGGSDVFDDSDSHAKMSWGAADGARQWAHGVNAADGQGTTQTGNISRNARCIVVNEDAGGTPAIDGDASFDAFVAGGVRINWQNALSDDYEGIAILFAGADLTARADSVAISAQDVENDVTALGFRPKVLFASSPGQGANTIGEPCRLSIGCAVDNGSGYDQRSVIYQDYDNVGTSRVRGRVMNNRIGGRGDNTYNLEVTSPDASGFSLYARNGSPSGDVMCYLALKFDNLVKLFGYSAATGTGNQATTGIGFQPTAVVMGNCSQTVENTDQEQDMEHGFGAFSSSVERCFSINSENAAGTSDCNSNVYDRAYTALEENAGSTGCDASFVSFDSDGFTLNFSAVYGGARKSWGVAFGPVPSGPPPRFMMVS